MVEHKSSALFLSSTRWDRCFLTDPEDCRESISIVFGVVGVLIYKDVMKETKMELDETETNLSPSW